MDVEGQNARGVRETNELLLTVSSDDFVWWLLRSDACLLNYRSRTLYLPAVEEFGINKTLYDSSACTVIFKHQ